jgi:hypothetical protein
MDQFFCQQIFRKMKGLKNSLRVAFSTKENGWQLAVGR